MKRVIYGLSDPSIDGKLIRYVGYTSKNPKIRLSEHLYEARKRKCHRHHWLMSMSAIGVVPEISILEEVTEENWRDRERWWIASLAGNNLVNSTEGGEGLINPSDDVRRRISEKVSVNLKGNSYRSGIPHKEEYKKKISDSLLRSEAKRAADNARRGKPGHILSQEARDKISRAHRGRKRPDISERMKGNTNGSKVRHTAEFKASVAERNRQSAGLRWITDGSVRKFHNPSDPIPDGWRLGIPSRVRGKHSEESKAKMAEARRRYHAEKKAKKG